VQGWYFLRGLQGIPSLSLSLPQLNPDRPKSRTSCNLTIRKSSATNLLIITYPVAVTKRHLQAPCYVQGMTIRCYYIIHLSLDALLTFMAIYATGNSKLGVQNPALLPGRTKACQGFRRGGLSNHFVNPRLLPSLTARMFHECRILHLLALESSWLLLALSEDTQLLELLYKIIRSWKEKFLPESNIYNDENELILLLIFHKIPFEIILVTLEVVRNPYKTKTLD
jgi:hypothetical protein